MKWLNVNETEWHYVTDFELATWGKSAYLLLSVKTNLSDFFCFIKQLHRSGSFFNVRMLATMKWQNWNREWTKNSSFLDRLLVVAPLVIINPNLLEFSNGCNAHEFQLARNLLRKSWIISVLHAIDTCMQIFCQYLWRYFYFIGVSFTTYNYICWPFQIVTKILRVINKDVSLVAQWPCLTIARLRKSHSNRTESDRLKIN